MRYDLETVAYEVRARLGTGLRVHTVHDMTDKRWCVLTVGLHSNQNINAPFGFYGQTLDEAIDKLYELIREIEIEEYRRAQINAACDCFIGRRHEFDGYS